MKPELRKQQRTQMELYDAWETHCKNAGHITLAEARERGEKISARHVIYATYKVASGQIWCHAPKCQWTAKS